MNPKNIYIVLMCFCATFGFAQEFSIAGGVKDDANNPIAYANVLLLKAQDSTLLTGTTTDDNGRFVLSDIPEGSYILRASFIGFETQERTIELSNDITLPILILSEAPETLSEVELIIKKPTLKREVDRLVFNVEKTSLSEGNMMDVLRSTPGVLVLDNSISVKNGSPTVYINDRKVHLTMDEVVELLQGTPATNIKSVEVITNPPARYDAESGAVLNIVMSKNLITGYRGSIFSNYTQGVFPKTNHGMTHFFKTSKLSIYTNYSYNNRKVDRVNRERIDYLNDNNVLDQRWTTNLDRNTRSETHNINANVDYDFNANNQLSLSTNMLFLPYFKYTTRGNTDIEPAQPDAISNFKSNNLSRDVKKNLGFNLDFIHTFGKDDSKLSFNSHLTIYDYRRKQRVDSDYFLGDGSFFETNAFRTRSDQTTDIFTSQIDYELPINETSSFEAGVKYSNVKTESAIVQRNIENGQESIDLNNTDTFDYKEDVYAGYLSYKKDWEKWQLNFGIRAEQTQVEGLSMLINETNTQDYLEFFPTANLLYQASEKVDIYANYNRRIQRPNYSNLNPFKFFLNDNTIVTGNPDLQPVFIDHYVLGTSINDTYTFEVYYKKNTDNISEFPIQDNAANTISYTPINLSETNEFGLDFLVYFDLTERWTSSFLTSMYYTEDQGVFQGTKVAQDKWANYSQLGNSFTFLKDNSLSIDFVLVYSSANIQGLQLVEKGQLFSDLSIRKTLFKNKAVLSVAVSDLFNDQDYFTRTKVLNQDSALFTNLDNRYVRVGFRYKFGNTKLSTNEKDISKDERDRLQSSN